MRLAAYSLVCLFAIFGAVDDASAEDRLSERIAAVIDETARAPSADHEMAAYAKFFSELSAADMLALVNHRQTTLALLARWELLSRGDAAAQRDSHPQRWLGFFEGRTGVTPPARWAAILSALPQPFQPHCTSIYEPSGLVTSNQFTFTGDNGATETVTLPCVCAALPLRRTSAGFLLNGVAGRDADVVRNDNGLRLTARGRALQVPENSLSPLWQAYTGRNARCSLYLGEKRSYVAFFSEWPRKYPIVCLETSSGRMLWQAEVWAHGDVVPLQFGTVPSDHRVELAAAEDVVASFGSDGARCYVEGFDAKTGAVRFRFSPDYRENAAYQEKPREMNLATRPKTRAGADAR